ncbi:uncharacterized protein LOC124703659 [Lolium rigidum]|uniref:uncharacterized protein LOC124703659 n=1 Tax=Lolium rigidum TaxID=89674 RepID=UPI001F5C7830|nr:uncharacterized protein LOC124703659 [Lolium rigidum]
MSTPKLILCSLLRSATSPAIFWDLFFYPKNGDCLHIELAKSNSRKRNRGGGDVYKVIDKRVYRTEEQSENDNNGGEGDDDFSDNGDGGDNDGNGVCSMGFLLKLSTTISLLLLATELQGRVDTENDNSNGKDELPADQRLTT